MKIARSSTRRVVARPVEPTPSLKVFSRLVLDAATARELLKHEE